MPRLPIIDAHVHLWDPARLRIDWLPAIPLLNRRYGLDDYTAATEGLEVEGFVCLEVDAAPNYTQVEARALVELALADNRIKGIVPFAPLEDGERVRSYLAALVALGDKIKGIRRLTQALPDPAFCLQPDFIRGARLLPEYGLSCDLGITYRQLGPTVELVRQCPETRFILDHIAKPNIRGRELEPWRAQMTDLASLPNIVCKVSGVLTEASANWTPDEVAPYVRHIIEVFGEDRIVFGSDWPVLLQAASYRKWVDLVDHLTVDFSEAAQRKLWSENAKRFYRLDSDLITT